MDEVVCLLCCDYFEQTLPMVRTCGRIEVWSRLIDYGWLGQAYDHYDKISSQHRWQ